MTDKKKHTVVVGLEVHRRRVGYERRWFEEDEYTGAVAAPSEPREPQPRTLPPFLRRTQ